MRHLLRTNVDNFHDWGVKLLVKQIADQDVKVASVGLSVLDEAADDKECLDSLIGKKPDEALLKMGRAGKDLLTRCLSRSTGFRYVSSNLQFFFYLIDLQFRK
jgi:hypothetical protein